MTKDELKAKLKELRERVRVSLENRDEGQHEEMFGNLLGAQEYTKDYDKLDLFVDTLVSSFGPPIAMGMASGRMSRWCAENAMRDAPNDDLKGEPDDDQEDQEENA